MNNLKTMRESKNLSQRQLAEKAGINLRTLQDYELGRSDIDGAKLKTLLAICDALECRISAILNNAELIEAMNAYECN